MTDVSPDVSRDELLSYLEAQGAPASAAQLVRWHKSGLLPRPRSVGLGRGLGTETRYPESARSQALLVCLALKNRRSLERAAWLSWLGGFPVTARVRRELMVQIDEGLRWIRRQLRDFKREVSDNAIDRAGRQRPLPGLKDIPRAFRPTLLRMFLEAGAGVFSPKIYDSSDFARIEQSLQVGSSATVAGDNLLRELLESHRPSSGEIASPASSAGCPTSVSSGFGMMRWRSGNSESE